MSKQKKQGSKVNRQIAGVHLTSKIWQTFVAVLGVTFGVSMYIFMNSFMNGVNATQDDLAFSTLAHVRIYNDDEVRTYDPVNDVFQEANTLVNLRNRKSIQYTEGIKNTSRIISIVEKQPEVAGVTPQLNFSVFFRNGSKKINGSISGVDVLGENELFGIADKVVEGDWNELETRKSGIILGKVLAQKLNVNVGDNVNVMTPEGVSKNYEVLGLIETSVKDIDKSRAYLNITTARQLQGENFDYSSDIQLNLNDKDRTAEIVRRLEPLVPYQVESWQTANQQMVAGSQLRNIIAIAVSLTILIVAGFGIYNIMNMTINEKIREIAILKAMGFSGKDILRIFLTQATVIGFVGGITGVGLGYGISSLVHRIPFKIAGLSTLPISYQLQDFVAALAFGIATTLLAGYLPARKASKIDPVVIIRG
ncbi:ABC transporter permease [Mangrovibacterium diazotrophicum]|uniref:Lipoprotein-releasing system permease protein n=1 Tax=Mangrovibacterium diazotrophicum TaxID=1261403 RepID=A0A419W473_9BACT|nr:FtsX-like permease family protein [Mangrovibacterium diazotrophicum]RKD90247.1 lipoprotein-releasing system permease protein [Mangrovibacterium diazotrophicum]